MARALIRRRRVFLAKIETTDGTAETLTAADGQFIAFSRALNPNVEMNRRPRQDGFGYHTSVPGARSATLPITVQAHGSGGSGTASLITLLRACGGVVNSSTVSWADGTGYAPITTGIAEDGRLRRMSGASGTFGFQGRAGNPVDFNFEFTGKLLTTDTSFSLPSVTYPTVVPPRLAAATVTVGGTAYKIATVGFALNATVSLREDPAADDDPDDAGNGTGYHAAQVVDVDPVFSIDPEASTSKDWLADQLAGTTAALSIVLGADAGNTITISASAVQVRSTADGDRNGIITDPLELECTGSTLFSIAFS